MTEFDKLWAKFYKNDSLREHFRSNSDSAIAHAYILEGPHGSGKSMLALTVCATLTRDPGKIGKIFAGYCPDVIRVVRRDGRKTLGVDDIRAIRSTAWIRPGDLDFKVYLIDECDCMSVQAQNALLKLLEEPPENVYFFLMCENAAALLPTVRSRAPVLRMQTFPQDELAEYLRTADPEIDRFARSQPDAFAALLQASSGSIGAARELFSRRSSQSLASPDQQLDFLEKILSGNRREIWLACLNLPKKREELASSLHQTRIALRDMAALRTAKKPELLFGSADRLGRIAGQVSIARILRTEAELCAKEDALASNINVQNAKVSLASALCRIS